MCVHKLPIYFSFSLAVSFHHQHKTKNKTEGNKKKKQTTNTYVISLGDTICSGLRRTVYLYNVLLNDVYRISAEKEASITTLMMAWHVTSIVCMNIYFVS